MLIGTEKSDIISSLTVRAPQNLSLKLKFTFHKSLIVLPASLMILINIDVSARFDNARFFLLSDSLTPFNRTVFTGWFWRNMKSRKSCSVIAAFNHFQERLVDALLFVVSRFGTLTEPCSFECIYQNTAALAESALNCLLARDSPLM